MEAFDFWHRLAFRARRIVRADEKRESRSKGGSSRAGGSWPPPC